MTATGMRTRLYDKSKDVTGKPSTHPETERFLDDLEKTLGRQIKSKILQKETRDISKFEKDLRETLKDVRKEKDWVLAPTNKTNRWMLTKTSDYISWMQNHIDKACNAVRVPAGVCDLVADSGVLLVIAFSNLIHPCIPAGLEMVCT